MNTAVIRELKEQDNPAIARIIRDTLAEFGANKPGTVYFDATTDNLYHLFRQPRSVYYIAATGEEVLGGAGIFPTDGLPADTCELVKMYLLPQARGLGLGRALIGKCLAFARQTGYKNVYLETMPELRQALQVYKKLGFEYLSAPMGNSGHTGCSLWMMKEV